MNTKLAAALIATIAVAGATAGPAQAASSIRLNQVGYPSSQPKRAFLMTSASAPGVAFKVVNASSGATALSGTAGARIGSWNANYPNVYPLDFNTLKTAGTYKLVITGAAAATSPNFRITSGASLYTTLVGNARTFFRAQRDGANVFNSVLSRKPSHLKDKTASIYNPPSYNANNELTARPVKIGGPRDVEGGWHDAGDYLKFVHTTAYAESLILNAILRYPSIAGAGAPGDMTGEARHGLQWLLKMWSDSTKTLYYQVGIGDGNGSTIYGDHDYWRLPEADDNRGIAASNTTHEAYYVEYRPLLRAGAANALISPNIAGRLSAAFAGCYRVWRTSDPAFAKTCLLAAQHVFDLAKTTSVGTLLTASPHAYYPEVLWADDMELGAAELYHALAAGPPPSGLPHSTPSFYLSKAAHWAKIYLGGNADYREPVNLYDVGGLAHRQLHKAITGAGNPSGLEVTKAQLTADLARELDEAIGAATGDPFGGGHPEYDVVMDTLGLVAEADAYRELTASTKYDGFARRQLDYVLGANAWGTSFVIGAGTRFPHCPGHQVANLSGSLNGTSPVLLGAVAQGPNSEASTPGAGMGRACNNNIFGAINSGKRDKWYDAVTAWWTTEPSLATVAITLPVFAARTAAT